MAIYIFEDGEDSTAIRILSIAPESIAHVDLFDGPPTICVPVTATEPEIQPILQIGHAQKIWQERWFVVLGGSSMDVVSFR
jgi:hypothetical protein